MSWRLSLKMSKRLPRKTGIEQGDISRPDFAINYIEIALSYSSDSIVVHFRRKFYYPDVRR